MKGSFERSRQSWAATRSFAPPDARRSEVRGAVAHQSRWPRAVFRVTVRRWRRRCPKGGPVNLPFSDAFGGRLRSGVPFVPDGAQKKAVQLNLPAGASINEISLHPSGNKFAATLGSAKRDIWILDGLRPPASYFSRWPWTTVNVFDVLGSVRINQRSGVLLAR